MFEINSDHWLLFGLALIIVTMLRLTIQRMRKTSEQQERRAATVQAAKEAERKRRLEAVIPKAQVASPKTRAPLVDPFGTHFTGNIQGVAAKWEAEIHQIGRQIIGQIDCKMAALQAITLDANRTANRLEILVEHLEQIARQHIEWQQQQIAQNAKTDSSNVPLTVIPAAAPAPEAAPFTHVLQELTEDLESIRKTIQQSTTFSDQPEPITVLRPAVPQKEAPFVNLRKEVQMLSNYGLEPQEIARRLDISLGEVDLMLQIQQNRLDQTT